jgi:two-component system sensor histidine kinase CpxA
MAERLEGLLVSKSRLLEDISHELRSPLARLTLAVKLARTSSDSRAALDRIEREVRRITALTAEIVEMTRMDGDPLILKLDSVNLAELVQEAIDDCSAEMEPRACNIKINDQFRGTVFADHELLVRAVENILRNAIRYSPELTPIDIVIAQNSGDVLITIRDCGPGVPADSLSLIFEPFFRVDTVRDAETGGIGLGLSIARRAVQLHHGTVTAQNASPGLRVEICLPRR